MERIGFSVIHVAHGYETYLKFSNISTVRKKKANIQIYTDLQKTRILDTTALIAGKNLIVGMETPNQI
jgi:hypothetical protein